VGNCDDDFPVGPALWGEEFLSIRPLLQKFSAIGVMYFGSSTTAAQFVYPHYYPAPFKTNASDVAQYQIVDNGLSYGNQPFWTYFSHYAMMFAGVRGSTRVKVMGDPSLTQSVSVVPGTDVEAFDNATAAPAFDPFIATGNAYTSNLIFAPGVNNTCFQAAINGGAEFHVPGYMDTRYQLYRWISNSTGGGATDRIRRNIILTAPTTSTTTRSYLRVFYAGGPDVALIAFRRTPAMITSGI
jgi:hypothetical protein